MILLAVLSLLFNLTIGILEIKNSKLILKAKIISNVLFPPKPVSVKYEKGLKTHTHSAL